MKMLMVLVFATLLFGCSSNSDATRALTQAGFTDIQTHGHAWFSCGQDDTFATKFTAKNPAGKSVSGVVCSAWLKGSTIRFD